MLFAKFCVIVKRKTTREMLKYLFTRKMTLSQALEEIILRRVLQFE